MLSIESNSIFSTPQQLIADQADDMTDTGLMESNSSLSNVTAGWEEENSLTVTEIVLISYACCSIVVWVIVIILYKLELSDTLADVWDTVKHPKHWNFLHNSKFLLIVCTVIGGWIPTY